MTDFTNKVARAQRPRDTVTRPAYAGPRPRPPAVRRGRSRGSRTLVAYDRDASNVGSMSYVNLAYEDK